MKTYDPKCAELARYFLDDTDDVTEARVQQLASEIQELIEDFLTLTARPEPRRETRR